MDCRIWAADVITKSDSVAVCVIGCPVAVAVTVAVTVAGAGRPGPARRRAGPGPGAAGGAAQHVKKIQHVRKAHSSYAIFAVLDEIDVLSSWNVTGDRNLPGKPGGGRPTARDAESRPRATRPLPPIAGRHLHKAATEPEGFSPDVGFSPIYAEDSTYVKGKSSRSSAQGRSDKSGMLR